MAWGEKDGEARKGAINKEVRLYEVKELDIENCQESNINWV